MKWAWEDSIQMPLWVLWRWLRDAWVPGEREELTVGCACSRRVVSTTWWISSGFAPNELMCGVLSDSTRDLPSSIDEAWEFFLTLLMKLLKGLLFVLCGVLTTGEWTWVIHRVEKCIVNHLEKDTCEEYSVTYRMYASFYDRTTPLAVEGMYMMLICRSWLWFLLNPHFIIAILCTFHISRCVMWVVLIVYDQ